MYKDNAARLLVFCENPSCVWLINIYRENLVIETHFPRKEEYRASSDNNKQPQGTKVSYPSTHHINQSRLDILEFPVMLPAGSIHG